jgi:hypothetical protein
VTPRVSLVERAGPPADRLAAEERTILGTSVRLFVSVWLVYTLFLNPYPASLASNMLALAVSVVDRGSVELHLYHGPDVSSKDGRYLPGLPPGGSVPAAILYGLLRLFIPPFAVTEDLVTLNVLAILLISTPAAALCVVLVYRVLRRLPMPESARLLTVGLYAFGTMHFGFATIYAKESIVALILLGVFALGSDDAAARRLTPARAVGIGLLLAYAVATAYAVVVQIAVLGLYLATRLRLRPLMLIGAGLAAGIVPLLVYHQVTYGNPFANAYTYRGFATPQYLYAPDPGRFVEIMLAPNTGLLIYTPIVALSAVGLYRAFRRGIHRAEVACIAGIILATWIFYAGYRLPLTGWYVLPSEAHFATRYLHVAMPFAMIGVGLAFPWVPAGLTRALGAASVFFAYLAAQAGLIPQWEVRLVYTIKVLISSFGMGMLFGQFVPERLGVETLHTVLRRPDVGVADLLAGPTPTLIHLVASQLVFFGLFLAAAAVVGVLLWLLWRPAFRAGGPLASCAESAAS